MSSSQEQWEGNVLTKHCFHRRRAIREDYKTRIENGWRKAKRMIRPKTMDIIGTGTNSSKA